MAIYRLEFEDGRIDWCNAKNKLHLLKSYNEQYDLFLQEVECLEEISEDEAKTTMVKNTEFDEDNPGDMPEELSLWELSCGDDFYIIASTEFI